MSSTTLHDTAKRLLERGELVEALGVWYLGGGTLCCDCPCPAAHVLAIPAGPRLLFCADCQRPDRDQRDRIVGVPPYGKGDVAVYLGELVTLQGAPGPTGVVRCVTVKAPTEVQVHLALLNVEDTP